MGRYSKQIDLQAVENLAAAGCSIEEISNRLHVAESTFYKYKSLGGDLCHAYELGRAERAHAKLRSMTYGSCSKQNLKTAIAVLEAYSDIWKAGKRRRKGQIELNDY